MKKIAIITGASSGMGKVFAETINTYDTFDEVWVIARRLDRLESLQETVPFPVRPIALDLTDRESFRLSAGALYRRLRGKQGVRSELQPRAQPGAGRQGHFRHGSLPVLDEDRVL